MSKKVHTPHEHPLDIRIIDRLQDTFRIVEYDVFWFATLWIFITMFLFDRRDPNTEQYWEKIRSKDNKYTSLYVQLEKIDRLIKKIPFIKRYGWNVAACAVK